MSGHTPGPWDVGNGGALEPRTNVYCDDSLGSLVATCGHRYTVAIPVSQEEANARLIAAAPELLEAGKALVERWDTPRWKDVAHTAEFIHALRDAIAKATGASA